MKTLRCERQSLVLQAANALFGIGTIVFVGAVLDRVGFQAFLALMLLVMLFYTWNPARGTLEALSVYRYDEDGIERRRPLRRERIAWAEVRDLRIQRSTGDSSIFLKGEGGRPLRVDFQLLGERGGELLQFLLRRLGPLIEGKLAAMEQEPRLFPRRHMGLVPLSGSVRAGAGMIRLAAARAPELRLDSVSEVVVRELKKLVTTQEYLVKGEGGQVRFSSYVNDSPLLIRYLRRHVPEDRWTVGRSSGVFFAKLVALALVPVMAFAALTMLGVDADRLATERALAVRSQSAQATVLGAYSIRPGRYVVQYSFPSPKSTPGREADEVFGAVEGRGEPPAPGTVIRVRFDPRDPHRSRPEPGQGIEMPSVWRLVVAAVMLLLLSIPMAVATLAFRVHPDPFEDWIFDRTDGPAAPPLTPSAGAGS